MNKFKIINWIQRVIKFPIVCFMFPFFAVIGFFMTNWENQEDRDFYKRTMISLFK